MLGGTEVFVEAVQLDTASCSPATYTSATSVELIGAAFCTVALSAAIIAVAKACASPCDTCNVPSLVEARTAAVCGQHAA